MIERLRRLGSRPRLEPAVALALRAAQVREPLRFAAREALASRAVAAYRLRSSGLWVIVRHGTGDVVTLGEVFHRPDYAPPAPVAAALGAAPRIVDLGANVGMFGLYALGRWPHARITGYEPDPANAALHERAIERNGLQERWRLLRAAAGTAAGRARFAAGGVALSHLDAGGQIEVAVCDVLRELAGADLAKIDIEGGEWAILADPRFAAAPPRALVLEYHPRGCPSPSPAAAVRELLVAAGLVVMPLWERSDGHGMLWAWR